MFRYQNYQNKEVIIVITIKIIDSMKAIITVMDRIIIVIIQ